MKSVIQVLYSNYLPWKSRFFNVAWNLRIPISFGMFTYALPSFFRRVQGVIWGTRPFLDLIKKPVYEAGFHIGSILASARQGLFDGAFGDLVEYFKKLFSKAIK